MKRMYVELGEFRGTADEERPLTASEIRRGIEESRRMHAHIDYPAVIRDLEAKLLTCKKSMVKDIESMIILAKRQQAAGFGKK